MELSKKWTSGRSVLVTNIWEKFCGQDPNGSAETFAKIDQGSFE
jgi:hypothetical protein